MSKIRDIQEVYGIEWVLKSRAIELLGFSEGQIRSKIARKWTRGRHFAIIDGQTWVNLREVQEWITHEASGQCEEKSRSGTALPESGTKKRLTSNRLGLV